MDCNDDEHQYRVKINKVKKECYNTFGFVADPEKTLWENSKEIVANTPAPIYFDAPATKGYHNLCTILEPPPGVAELLGLGHKICDPKAYCQS
eukprot:3004610-Ditylum_brightwellii.AAC.1